MFFLISGNSSCELICMSPQMCPHLRIWVDTCGNWGTCVLTHVDKHACKHEPSHMRTYRCPHVWNHPQVWPHMCPHVRISSGVSTHVDLLGVHTVTGVLFASVCQAASHFSARWSSSVMTSVVHWKYKDNWKQYFNFCVKLISSTHTLQKNELHPHHFMKNNHNNFRHWDQQK